ncbi:peptidylprolyl isomerase [Wenzhouxiangella sediminis]|uniref:peptidylprolyl isomerase n=1 Tax=Wenzhouxiangella sediminis TaxID=1792836 RepID=A0A3E1KBN1_9GAMM|nr:peptidyl-prolyl cis-trans isomerase [Wenzhouxiangella sediminis]RFF32028.1 hypothetical protein DZC52_03275 [Wenzhouxiangella sediminis]
MQRFPTWLVLLPILALAACRQPADEGERVLARIGEETITVSEFEHEMARRSQGRPMYFKSADNRRALLEELLRHRMLVQEARDVGIDQEPEFRALVERMLIQRLREKRLEARLEADAPTDEAVAAYYEENRETFSRPARRQVAMIRIDVPPSAGDEARAAARDRAEAALQGVSELPAGTMHFGPLAVEHSDDRSSRYQGGVVGWLVDGQSERYRWPQPVLEAAYSLEEDGETSPVIETAEAFYIVRLAALQPGRTQPLEQVADGIRHRLQRERSRALERDLFVDIAEGHTTEIDEAVLESVEPPHAAPVESDSPEEPPALPSDPTGTAQ